MTLVLLVQVISCVPPDDKNDHYYNHASDVMGVTFSEIVLEALVAIHGCYTIITV